MGIRTDIADCQLPTALEAPHDKTIKLAAIAASLDHRPDTTQQERLINWASAVRDAAMHRRVEETAPAPSGFPYAGGVG